MLRIALKVAHPAKEIVNPRLAHSFPPVVPDNTEPASFSIVDCPSHCSYNCQRV